MAWRSTGNGRLPCQARYNAGMDLRLTEHDWGITTIDTGYQRPGLVASHLIVEGGEAAFVDVGAAPGVDLLLATLRHHGIARSQVRWLLVTHVHLDHAGAAGVLLRELPNAQLVVHPRGARHMIDPSKLIRGATAVYGEQRMREQFGDILPAPAERVIEAPDGMRVVLAGRELLLLDTPGHARHHYCVYDEQSTGWFTGDTFGLSYRELDTERGAFIFPTTTPVQFDPEALHESIDRLMSRAPQRMFLTHFGMVTDVERLAAELHTHIERFVALARGVADAGARRFELLCEGLTEQLFGALRVHGCRLGRARVLELMEMDIRLNAQGLDYWLDHRAAAG